MFGNKITSIKVEGMMCEHCASHVKDALSKLEGVSGVKVDLSNKKADIKAKRDLNEEELRTAIEGAGYHYAGMIQ